MSSLILPKDRSLSKFVANSRTLDQLARRLVFSKLQTLQTGFLQIQEEQERFEFGDPTSGLRASVLVHRPSFYSRTLFGGSIGNAESYVDGDWDTDDLPLLIRLFVQNRATVQAIDSGVGTILAPIQKLFHGFRSNTIKGSRENIRAHYDIGNDFFKLFLDETMMYSCALFAESSTSLVDASRAKIAEVCRKLELKPTDHLIEIGTGWGSLAIYAAKTYGCKVTTTTISKEQYNYAREQIQRHGLEDKIELLFEDYRNLRGVYDKLVSVEMIEAVGLENLPQYFRKCSELLKPEGLMVIQAITIRNHNYEAAKNSVDFIQRHIFPGGGIPSVQSMLTAMASETDLVMIGQQDYAEDYAETLRRWSAALTEKQHLVTKLGYPDFLYRLWQFYSAYCEGGFRERAIGLSQLRFAKPLYKNRSFV